MFRFCVVLFFAESLIAQELDWPVEKDKKFQISSTFGESRMDHFHNGIDLPGEGFPVLSPADARVLYCHHDSEVPGEMPFGGGTTVVLDHGKLWTGYMHLAETTACNNEGQLLARGEKFASAGNSGHSGGPHLHFFIYEPAQRTLVNPLLILGQDYYRDKKPPLVKEWGVLLPEKFAMVNPQRPFRLSADYPVYVLIEDQGVARERWGIFEYRVFLDDREVLAARFDRLVFNDGWRLGGKYSFEEIFYRNFYTLTNQVRRARRIRLEARDLAGNTTERLWEPTIQQN